MSFKLDKKQQVKEILKCGKDPVYFLKTYARISHPMHGLILFDTYDFQNTLLRDFNDYRFNVILKARQLGISTITAGYITWLMLFHRDKAILVMATKFATAGNLVKKVKTILKNLPHWLKIADFNVDNKNSIELTNGSQVKASSTSGDAGRSEALSLLVIDEAAHIDGLDELWTGLYPTISTGGRCIALSTPNGVGGQYYDLYMKAASGENEFNPIKLPWDVHPERDQAWFEKETRNMKKTEIAQELLCDFASSGDTFLTNEVLEKLRLSTKSPIEKSGPEYNVWYWEYPLEGVNYVCSADISRGDSGDYSAFHIINTKDNSIAVEYKGKIPPDHFASLLYDVARRFNNAVICPENNAYGYSVLSKLKDLAYKNIYFSSEKEKYKFLYGDGTNIGKAGFTTSKESKEKILANFEESLRNNRLKTYSLRLFEELKTFVWNGKKVGAMKGYNDDLIMSLAIGCWITDSNSSTYNVEQIKQADALLKGMEVNNTKAKDTIMSPFYTNKNNVVNPFIPVYMSNDKFSSKEITKKNPLGDLSWLIGK